MYLFTGPNPNPRSPCNPWMHLRRSRWTVGNSRGLSLLLTLAASAICLPPATRAGEAADADWNRAVALAEGVLYTSATLAVPRPMKLHAVRIDAGNPRVRFMTTDRRADWRPGQAETDRRTVRKFFDEARGRGVPLVAAVNADAFSPWPAPWNRETPSDLLGLAVSEGRIVSPASGTPSLLIHESGLPSMAATTPETPVEGVRTAVSGFSFVLIEGEPRGEAEGELHPRTGLGLSRDRRFVTILVIDGRRHASHGATTREVGERLLAFGAWNGINMDGGGSTTLVRARRNPDGSAAGSGELLNEPAGDGTNWLRGSPRREAERYQPAERANGNNLGVWLEAAPGEGKAVE